MQDHSSKPKRENLPQFQWTSFFADLTESQKVDPSLYYKVATFFYRNHQQAQHPLMQSITTRHIREN